MLERMSIEAWVLAAFFGSCVGLGFAAGYVARRRIWGSWTIGVASAGVAFLWLSIVVVASRLTSGGPCELPCDAPGYAFTAIVAIVMPLLFVFSFVLAIGGALVAWRRFQPERATEQIIGREPR